MTFLIVNVRTCSGTCLASYLSTGGSFGEVNTLVVKLTLRLNVVPGLRMRGIIPPLSLRFRGIREVIYIENNEHSYAVHL